MRSWKLLSDGWVTVTSEQEAALSNDLESIFDAVYAAERRFEVRPLLDVALRLPIGGERLA